MERKQLVAPKASEDNTVELFLRSISTCLEGEKNKKSFPAAPPVYFIFDSQLSDSYEPI